TPNTDSGRFNLKIDSTVYDNAGAGYGDGGTTGFVNVSQGSHTISEAGNGTTSLTDYDRSIDCGSKGSNSTDSSKPYTASYGDVTTRTISTSRLPQIKVVKQLTPNTDSGRFNLKIDSTVYDNAGAGYGDGGTTVCVTVSRGTHPISEAANGTPSLTDYDRSIDCGSKGSNSTDSSKTFTAN